MASIATIAVGFHTQVGQTETIIAKRQADMVALARGILLSSWNYVWPMSTPNRNYAKP